MTSATLWLFKMPLEGDLMDLLKVHSEMLPPPIVTANQKRHNIGKEAFTKVGRISTKH